MSFNNDGPLGTFFRYIGDTGTYIARYDDLFNGKDEQIDVSKVDVSMNGIELQDREFFAAIREGREPNASVAQVLPCYRCCTRWSSSWTATKATPRISRIGRPILIRHGPACPGHLSRHCAGIGGPDKPGHDQMLPQRLTS